MERFSNYDPRCCTLCPRACGADRTAGAGLCGGGSLPRIARAALHFWEEPCISGDRGSGAVFFSGCSLGCLFCQNYDISARRLGREVTAAELAELFARLEAEGAHNLNLVTAGHYAPQAAEALERWRAAGGALPVVWNSGGYETAGTLRELDGLVDIYLPDLKYADAALGARLSGAADYFPTAAAALREMFRQTGPCRLDEDGMLLQRGVLVRHLVLPGHADDSIRVFEELSELVDPDDILVSVMSQYTPPGEYGRTLPDLPPELTRRVTPEEYELVCDCVEALGFEGFLQDPDSADAAYTPEWNERDE